MAQTELVTSWEPEIGGGHPWAEYVILKALAEQGVPSARIGLRNHAPFLTRVAMAMANWIYQEGPKHLSLYKRVRATDFGLQTKLLAHDMKLNGAFEHSMGGKVISTHYLTAAMAEIYRKTYGFRGILTHVDVKSYQGYGIPGWTILVPFVQTRDWLREVVRTTELDIDVVGPVIPNELVQNMAADAENRLAMIRANMHRVGVFLSGALPKPHVSACLNVVRNMPTDGRAQVVVWPGLAKRGVADIVENMAVGRGLRVARHYDTERESDAYQVMVVRTDDLYEAIDYIHQITPTLTMLVTMANERFSWGLAGIPTGVLYPQVGTACLSNVLYMHRMGYSVPIHAPSLFWDNFPKQQKLERIVSRDFNFEPPNLNGLENIAQAIMAV